MVSSAALRGWLLVGGLMAAPVMAGSGGLSVAQAWARPTPPSVTVGVVYLVIENPTPVADQLLTLSTPAAARVELHETKTEHGMMQMRPLEALDCPAGARIKSEPNGVHIMLVSLTRALKPGATFPLTLTFRKAGEVTVQVMVENRE